MKVDPAKLDNVLKKFGVGQGNTEGDKNAKDKKTDTKETLTTTLTAENKE